MPYYNGTQEKSPDTAGTSIFLFFKKKNIFFHMYECCAYMYVVYYECPWTESRTVGPPGTGVPAMSCTVGAGNQTQILNEQPVLAY